MVDINAEIVRRAFINGENVQDVIDSIVSTNKAIQSIELEFNGDEIPNVIITYCNIKEEPLMFNFDLDGRPNHIKR